MNKIYFTPDVNATLGEIISARKDSKLFVITPENVPQLVPPSLLKYAFTIDDSEKNKTIANAENIWQEMLRRNISRKDIVVNIGGGVTTDLGGFAAACYKRGIDYINVPTTLLAMVDASVGGKTGVDFAGIKNMIGAFRQPIATIINPDYLLTLPDKQLLSGWAEMLKHGLLMGGPELNELLAINPLDRDINQLRRLIRKSVEYKSQIVEKDPQEAGLRRILNLGHTAGHAFEAFAINNGLDITHGHAVAQGLITAIILSNKYYGFEQLMIERLVRYIKGLYEPIPFACNDYEQLIALMRQDKKNSAGAINFVLLTKPGAPHECTPISESEIKDALDLTRDF